MSVNHADTLRSNFTIGWNPVVYGVVDAFEGVDKVPLGNI